MSAVDEGRGLPREQNRRYRVRNGRRDRGDPVQSEVGQKWTTGVTVVRVRELRVEMDTGLI